MLAAADVFAALGEERPHRAAPLTHEAVAVMRAEVAAGRIDATAAEAVLAAADVATTRRRPDSAGLTPREIEVLRALAHGATNKVIARQLGVSPKTIDNQIQSIYPKLGVRTRAGATLAAMARGLLAN